MAAKNVGNPYDGRIRRAERLATLHPFTQEVLTFYKQIAEFQKSLHARMLSGSKPQVSDKKEGDKNLPALRQELKIEALLPHFQEFLQLVARSAPVTLAESARQLSTQASESWAGILQDYWATSGRDDRPNAAFDQFLPRAFLQPYAEHLAGERVADEISAFPFLSGIGDLRHDGSVLSAASTLPRLALLYFFNVPGNPAINWATHGADLFHASN